MLTVEEIIGFDGKLDEMMGLSCREDLWAVATGIRNGFYSEHGFDSFRGWLIVEGHSLSMRATADPASLIGVVTPVALRELIIDVAKEAYRLKTGLDLEEVRENWPPACRAGAAPGLRTNRSVGGRRLRAGGGQDHLSRTAALRRFISGPAPRPYPGA